MEIAIIIIFNAVIFYRTIFFGLVIDDLRWHKLVSEGVFKNQSILNTIKMRFYGCGTLGTNIMVDHIFTIFLHSLACVLIYLSLGKNQISFYAALLYACNPSNNQTSIWLNGRRYLVNIILILTMYLIGPLGLFLYPLMSVFQVNAIFSPVLISWKFLLISPLFLLFGNKHIIKWFNVRYNKIPIGALKEYKINRIIPVIKSYGFYFFKMLSPGINLFTYENLYYWGITKEGNDNAYKVNMEFSKGILALILTLTIFILVPENLKTVCLFMFLSTIQWCNIITATQTLTDRYMSLPNVFMMFFVSYFLHTFIPQYALYVIYGLLGFYIGKILIVMRNYNNLEDMYNYNIYFYPEGVSARSFKSSALLMERDFIAAWDVIRYGLHHKPNDFKLLFQGAICCKNFGEIKLAKDLIARAEKNYYLGQEKDLAEKLAKLKSTIS